MTKDAVAIMTSHLDLASVGTQWVILAVCKITSSCMLKEANHRAGASLACPLWQDGNSVEVTDKDVFTYLFTLVCYSMQ